MATFVRSLTQATKDSIVEKYNKGLTIRKLAELHSTSTRTVGRVLEEYGLASPVPRLKGEAYTAMQTLKKYSVTVDELPGILEMFTQQDNKKKNVPALFLPKEPSVHATAQQ